MCGECVGSVQYMLHNTVLHSKDDTSGVTSVVVYCRS